MENVRSGCILRLIEGAINADGPRNPLVRGGVERTTAFDEDVKGLEVRGEIVCVRDCIRENRAPFPGLCQALAEKFKVPRIARPDVRG